MYNFANITTLNEARGQCGASEKDTIASIVSQQMTTTSLPPILGPASTSTTNLANYIKLLNVHLYDSIKAPTPLLGESPKIATCASHELYLRTLPNLTEPQPPRLLTRHAGELIENI